jgi:hypothetical protein
MWDRCLRAFGKLVALRFRSGLEFLLGDLVLQVLELLRGLDGRGHHVAVALAQERFAQVLAIPLPHLVMRREEKVARVDHDHDPVLQSRETADLREITARLLELHLAVHGMKDPVVRVLGFQPSRQLALENDRAN